MTYEEFLDTELRHELRNVTYDPVIDIVYGTVGTGFIYRGMNFRSGSRVSLHLDDLRMRYRFS